MVYQVGTAFLTPGQIAEIEADEHDITWGTMSVNKHYIQQAQVAGTARDAGNGVTTDLRAGLILGVITASKKFAEWDIDNSETNGSDTIRGVLMHTVSVNSPHIGDQDRWIGVLVGGNVRSKKLLKPGNASRGIAGDGDEAAIRTAFGAPFLLDDAIYN